MSQVLFLVALVSSLFIAITDATALHVADDGLFHFMSIGDWGCMPYGGKKAEDERIVAKSFAAKAESLKARFILNTGDNFYRCGVHSKKDEVWKNTFEDVFSEESMMVPWYSCLGNHDYGYPGSAEAEMEYVSPRNNRWVMPSRYYYRRLEFPNEVNISLIVLDSSPCQRKYRSDDPSGWDPCADAAHSCPGCAFHANVVKESCTTQYEWLKGVLPKVPKGDWKIAMAHAPANEIDVEDLLKPLVEHKFELFINGHIHELSQYEVDNHTDMNFVTTGAGCQVEIPAAGEVLTPAKLNDSGASGLHASRAIWTQHVAGYTEHVFEDNFKTLATHFYNYKGDKIHRIAVAKRI